MRNKLKYYILAITLVIFYSCKINKDISIVNRLNTCLSNENIDLLLNDKENKKGKKLFITEVQFNIEQCVGLFRYEYAHARMSAGSSNYVLKGKDSLFFQSKNIEKNKKILDNFFLNNGNHFSDSEKKYIISIFIEKGATRGSLK